MPKRAAAALQDSPPSTAAITRLRRSWESGRVMHAGLPPASMVNHVAPRRGKAFRIGAFRSCSHRRQSPPRPAQRRRGDPPAVQHAAVRGEDPARRAKDLPEKLKGEWPGILAWAIAGCLEWQRIGLAPPCAVVDATKEYLEAEDA